MELVRIVGKKHDIGQKQNIYKKNKENILTKIKKKW